QKRCSKTAIQSLEECNVECDIAAHINREFDRKYSPTWQCAVGRSFCSCVSHQTSRFSLFCLDPVTVLL
ncbi:Dynein light chain 1, cytoplasmic, partial [Podiceps cristatus]